MNIANKITVFRLLMIPVLVVVMILYPQAHGLHGWIFIIASLSDFLDGYLARKNHLVTTFGKFLDPLADKMLAICALIMLIPTVPAWLVIVVVMREFTISGFRILAASNGVTIAASYWGKWKTTTQFIAIILILWQNTIIYPLPLRFDLFFLYISLILTLISLFDYIIKNIHVLDLKNI